MSTFVIALILALPICYMLFFILINVFERSLLGPLQYKPSKYIWHVTRKLPIYILLPMLFVFSGTSFFMLSNPSFQKVAKLINQQQVNSQEAPYKENQIKELEFPSMRKTLMWAIVATILIVSLTRITAFIYHVFLVHALLYSVVLSIGFFFMIFVINPSHHTVLVDNVVRANYGEVLIFILITGAIATFLTELMLMQFVPQLGFYPATGKRKEGPQFIAPAGVYICTHCHQTQFLPAKGALLPCTRCKGQRFRREK